MRLVDNDGKIAPFMFCADAVEDYGEFMYRGYNDLLAAVDGVTEITGMFSPCDSI